MKYLNKKYHIFESKINMVETWCINNKIKKYEVDPRGSLIIYQNVYLSNKDITKIPVKIKEVYGDFSICDCNISTLINSPKIVHGNFEVSYTNIKDLDGCPIDIGKDFLCHNNKKLIILYGFPKHVGNSIDLSECNLKTLRGINIKRVEGYFNVSSNKKLKKLEYGPAHVGDDYICVDCNLTSLYGCPNYIGGDFDFSYNNIYSFYYFPDNVEGGVYCNSNPVYNIWKLFEDKNQIQTFNEMRIIDTYYEKKINIGRLNRFLGSMNKSFVEDVDGYISV